MIRVYRFFSELFRTLFTMIQKITLGSEPTEPGSKIPTEPTIGSETIPLPETTVEIDPTNPVSQPGIVVSPPEKPCTPPGNRGGRPRTTRNILRDEPPEFRNEWHRSVLPDVVCWMRDGAWRLGVSACAKLGNQPIVKILQNSEFLQQDELLPGLWALNGLTGTIEIKTHEDIVIHQIDLGDQEFKFFRLSKRHFGRLSRNISHSRCALFLPEHCKSVYLEGGKWISRNNPTGITGYQMHEFLPINSASCQLIIRGQNGKEILLTSSKSCFGLKGPQIFDDHPKLGPLFVQEPPRIGKLGVDDWHHVKTIVMGEEGPRKKRWKTHFIVDPTREEQLLPESLALRQCGWFFVRFYDHQNILIDSMDFRYVQGLRDIHRPRSLLTTPAEEEIIVFEHEPHCRIQLISRPVRSDCFQTLGEKTVFQAPADPERSSYKFCIQQNHQSVTVQFVSCRLWWGLGSYHEKPEEWSQEVIQLHQHDLLPTHDKAIWLKMPHTVTAETLDVVYIDDNREKNTIAQYKINKKQLFLLSNFHGATWSGQVGIFHIFIQILCRNKILPIHIASIENYLLCLECHRQFFSKYDFKNHLLQEETSHPGLDGHFKIITIEQQLEEDQINQCHTYECAYCGWQASLQSCPSSLTALMCHHIERDCLKARIHGQPVNIHFIIVDKEGVEKKNYRLIHRCSLCGERFEDCLTWPQKIEHLWQKHQKELYNL